MLTDVEIISVVSAEDADGNLFVTCGVRARLQIPGCEEGDVTAMLYNEGGEELCDVSVDLVREEDDWFSAEVSSDLETEEIDVFDVIYASVTAEWTCEHEVVNASVPDRVPPLIAAGAKSAKKASMKKKTAKKASKKKKAKKKAKKKKARKTRK